MRDLRRRIEHLEQAAQLTRCICATPIVVFAGDPELGSRDAGSTGGRGSSGGRCHVADWTGPTRSMPRFAPGAGPSVDLLPE
jgi:hypothetical protein